MKYIISLGILCLILVSCNKNKCNCPIPVFGNWRGFLDISKDTSEVGCKIYTNINNYLKENLKDYSSYQPISFAEFKSIKPDSANKISIYLSGHGYYNDSIKVKPKKLDSLFGTYLKFKIIGYSIKHKYRAKNGFGAYGLSTQEFKLDTNFNVLYAKDAEYLQDATNSLMQQYESLKDK